MSPIASQRFRRSQRLRKRRDFQRVSQQGIRVAVPAYLFLVAEQRPAIVSDAPRLGVTVSRRVGGSVVRNRVKRRIREWFRQACLDLPAGRDLLVIARPGAAELTSATSANQLDSGASRLPAALARRGNR